VHSHHYTLAEHHHLPIHLAVFRQGLYPTVISPEDIKRYSSSILPIEMYLTRKHQTESNEEIISSKKILNVPFYNLKFPIKLSFVFHETLRLKNKPR
jgi:hypothetical protein